MSKTLLYFLRLLNLDGSLKDRKRQALLRLLATKPGFAAATDVIYREMSDYYDCYADFWEDAATWTHDFVIVTFPIDSVDFIRLRSKPFQVVLPDGDQPRGIHCMICDQTTFNPDDVAQHYCRHCDLFLNGATEK